MATPVTIEDLLAFENDEALKQIEEAQRSFNIFEVIGATHRELWHSDFLAFLLDPSGSHGLGDEFALRLLNQAVPELAGKESWSSATVRREYRYIDILIEDEQDATCLIIENKIWSPEGQGQLAKYLDIMQKERPGWDVCAIFLTPGGYKPSHRDYNALSYSAVKRALDDILAVEGRQIDLAVQLTLGHYSDMLGRFILGNADAESLARELYFKHRAAIQLMDPARWRGWIKSHLEHLIEEAHELQSVKSDMSYVRFEVHEWNDAEGVKGGTNETGKPLLYFTFYNFEDSLTLYLWIGPAVPSNVRSKLIELAERTPPFCKAVKADRQYHDIYNSKFLTRGDYESCSDEQLRAIIGTRWQEFVETDLPRMHQAFASADWLWHA